MLHVVFPASDSSVPAARRAARTVCINAGYQPALCDVLELLTSELVTNAVRHSPGRSIHVTVTAVPGGRQSVASAHRLRVEVEDLNPDLPALTRRASEAEHGRGMHLVNMLSAAWGAAPRANGKIVWFELAADRP